MFPFMTSTYFSQWHTEESVTLGPGATGSILICRIQSYLIPWCARKEVIPHYARMNGRPREMTANEETYLLIGNLGEHSQSYSLLLGLLQWAV